MLLRLATREEHLLSGGEARGFRADRRPGSAVWRGHEAQLGLVPEHPPGWRARVAGARLDEGDWALVTPRPERWLERLAAAHVAAAAVDARDEAVPVLVGDVESWLVEHLALGRVRRSGSLLLHGCTRADLRALTRSRAPVPPLGGDDEAWLVEGAEIRRVRVQLAREPAPDPIRGAASAQASPSGDSSNSSP
jgi:S-DNA-T family DNA segregation ATPase FtsK/SpoIIIE